MIETGQKILTTRTITLNPRRIGRCTVQIITTTEIKSIHKKIEMGALNLEKYKDVLFSLIIVSELVNIRQGDFISFKAYLSECHYTWKWTQRGEKRFQECELSDHSGTVFASFFEKARLANNNYYDFENMKVKVLERTFELQ